MEDFHDDQDADSIKTLWGVLGILMIIMSNATAHGSYNIIDAVSNFELAWFGWSLMYTFNSFTWGFTVLFWLLNLLVKDNETLLWLQVLFSNLTMFGPLGIYWLSLITILLGWVIDLFDLIGAKDIAKLVAWFFTAIVASFFQFKWIGEVRAIYPGDKSTFEDTVDNWHDTWTDDYYDETETQIDDDNEDI